jgi:hypothetical protein
MNDSVHLRLPRKDDPDHDARPLLCSISSSSFSTSATVLVEEDGDDDHDDSVTSATTEDYSSEEQPQRKLLVSSSDTSSSSFSGPDDDENDDPRRDNNRKVRFFPNLVLRSIPNDRTEEEVQESWISMREHYQNKKEIRARQYLLLEVPEYREAIQYVKRRLEQHFHHRRRRQHRRRGPIDIDCIDPDEITENSATEEEHYDDDLDNLDNFNTHDNDSHGQQQEKALEALTLGDRRGLERAGLCASRIKTLHARSIQEAYRKGMSDEYVAEICRKRSERALQWAQACK